MQGKGDEEHHNEKQFQSEKPGVEDIVESDVELDTSDVVEPDNDPPQKVVNWKS